MSNGSDYDGASANVDIGSGSYTKQAADREQLVGAGDSVNDATESDSQSAADDAADDQERQEADGLDEDTSITDVPAGAGESDDDPAV